MALTLGDNFSYQGAKPLDARLIYSTAASMKAVADSTMYDGCMAYCTATDKTYQWKSTNTADETTGKWREYSGGSSLPTGGTTGQALVKHSNSDGDVEWAAVHNVPAGGTAGQVLSKNSGTDYDAAWADAFYLKYEEKSLGVNNFTYNNGNLVDDGETKIFHSYWPAGTTSGQNAGLPDTDIVNCGRHYYIEMTKSADGTSFVQRCRKFYTVTNTDYFKMYNRRCEKSGSTWTFSDWIELDVSANLPVTPNQFDKANMYSTTEKVVGSWTDGRPVYQKSFNATLPNNTTSFTVTTLSGIDNIISTHVCGKMTLNGHTYRTGQSSTYVAGLNDYAWNMYMEDNNLVMSSGTSNWSGWKGASVVVTIQYTKTTDAANSFKYASENDYSTTEKIVGTWIDGKPLYQKTINFGQLPNNNKKTVAHSISNLKRVISFEAYAAYSSSANYIIPLPYSDKGGTIISMYREGANIAIETSSDMSTYGECCITIKYTKTTD